ncbi:MAG TPA: hypothetical protein VGH28_01200 [Polyangiaceae bacterium]|jgi:hypothetical protein
MRAWLALLLVAARRSGKGTCGKYLVFAEEQRAGAGDSHRSGCGDFGTIPKSKLQIGWSPLEP